MACASGLAVSRVAAIVKTRPPHIIVGATHPGRMDRPFVTTLPASRPNGGRNVSYAPRLRCRENITPDLKEEVRRSSACSPTCMPRECTPSGNFIPCVNGRFAWKRLGCRTLRLIEGDGNKKCQGAAELRVSLSDVEIDSLLGVRGGASDTSSEVSKRELPTCVGRPHRSAGGNFIARRLHRPECPLQAL